MRIFIFPAHQDFALKLSNDDNQNVSITEIYGKVPPNGHWFLEVGIIPDDAP